MFLRLFFVDNSSKLVWIDEATQLAICLDSSIANPWTTRDFWLKHFMGDERFHSLFSSFMVKNFKHAPSILKMFCLPCVYNVLNFFTKKNPAIYCQISDRNLNFSNPWWIHGLAVVISLKSSHVWYYRFNRNTIAKTNLHNYNSPVREKSNNIIFTKHTKMYLSISK